MTDKEKQRELIVEIMKADEESGLYDEPSKKQTAVDRLFTQLWETPKDKMTWYKILMYAKKREKEQMWEVSKEGIFSKHEFEEYYKETYGEDE